MGTAQFMESSFKKKKIKNKALKIKLNVQAAREDNKERFLVARAV